MSLDIEILNFVETAAQSRPRVKDSTFKIKSRMTEINRSVCGNRIENYYEMNLWFTEGSLKNLLAALMRGKVNIPFETLQRTSARKRRERKFVINACVIHALQFPSLFPYMII